jgi:hypothetical protein
MNILGNALLRAFDERAACFDLNDHHDLAGRLPRFPFRMTPSQFGADY